MRSWLGIRLLRPTLLAELEQAMQQHAKHAHHPVDPLERYWMGRCTALRIILERDSS